MKNQETLLERKPQFANFAFRNTSKDKPHVGTAVIVGYLQRIGIS
jgi:hypothetical protein